jgi:twitching motility protein PilT
MQYRIMRQDGTSRVWNSTHTKNISAAGICFESFHPLGLNTMLEVNLIVPFFKTPIELKSRVVRAVEIKAGEIYGVAASIVDISAADRKKLQIEIEQIDISTLLHSAVTQGATDVHLSLGFAPVIRKAGVLVPMEGGILGKSALKRMIFSLLSEEQITAFTETGEINTAVTIVTVDGAHRFRLNVHTQQGIVEAVFHLIKVPVPSLQELNLPAVIGTFVRKKSGLLIITGASGAGKTTTCASLVEEINTSRSKVIMTFQRCIEYIHPGGKSIIRHREIGKDAKTFASALEQALYQDPDVLVVSELADPHSMELILDAAQTGKLVILTFSSAGVVMGLQKIINAFPAEKQYFSRKALSQCLLGVVFQKLLPCKTSDARQLLAAEVLINSPEISDIIREGLLEKIPGIIMSDARYGMRSFEKSVKELWNSGLISTEIAGQFNLY